MKRFLLLAVAALTLVGCNNVFEDAGNSSRDVCTMPTLVAGFEDADTRTYVESNKHLRWHEGDLISAFVGDTKNVKYVFDGKTGDTSGEFKPANDAKAGTGNIFDKIYAVYPYEVSTAISNDGVIRHNLPTFQTYADNSFGKGANPMVAVAESMDDTSLIFKNVCGYLKIKLFGDSTVKNITICGNNYERITGSSYITVTYNGTPDIAMVDDGLFYEPPTLDCGEGVKLSNDAKNPTEFWFVLPPMTFEKGITITVMDTTGGVLKKTTNKQITIQRNIIQPMAAIEVEFESFESAKPANNEIWYTSSDGNIIEPHRTDGFGANILSNTYKNGKGVITFDGDVTTIGDSAFDSCESLTSIAIPDSVTTIGEWAFGYCSSLTSVTIPDSVTTIGNSAFKFCDGLIDVTIPDSVTSIGDSLFLGCTNLKEFKGGCASDDGYSLIINGVLVGFASGCGVAEYTIQDDVLAIGAEVFVGCDSLINVIIPDSVTAIGWHAFRGCDGFVSITIPNSVTSIGYGAFYYCSNLESITIPDGVTMIPHDAFQDCVNLTSVTIPDGVTEIGARAFRHCSSLTSLIIPNSVIKIKNQAFEGCGLTSITIPDSVTEIGSRAFYGGSLREFKGKHASDDGCCLIIDGVLSAFAYSCGATEYIIPDSVTTIGEWVFGYCDSLTSITIPDSVTAIGDRAFYNCYSLTSVTIGDSVTTIGNNAFQNCVSLTSITIPDSVTTIGNNAFQNCGSLTSVTIGDSVTTIEDCAFCNCDSLTSVTIPDSVTTIGEWAFNWCSSLTSVYCKATTPPSIGYKVFDDNANSRKIYVPTESVDAYKSASGWDEYADDIVGYNFETEETSPILTLTSPSLVEFGPEGGNGEITFTLENPKTGCSVQAESSASWVKPTVSSSKISYVVEANTSSSAREAKILVTYDQCYFEVIISQLGDNGSDDGFHGNIHYPSRIPNNEIWYMSSTETIITPNNTTDFGANIVSNTYDNDRCVIEFDGPVTKIPAEAFKQKYSLTEVVIPHSVTEIGANAFYNCSGLTAVFIGNGVETIGNAAFRRCAKISSITIPNSVKTIGSINAESGEGVFERCTGLTNVIIGSNVSTIGNYSFNECEGISKIVLPNSVITVGNYAFSWCANLTTLDLGNSVTTIGDYAFYMCTELLDVDFPTTVKNIEQWAFGSCSKLKSIELPDSITEVKYHSFAGCSSVTSIHIPNSVTYMDWGAFAECTSITNVTIPESVVSMGPYIFLRCYKLNKVICERKSPPTIDYGVFYDCSSNLKIYVPAGCASSYRSSWSDYKDNIVGDDGDDDDGNSGGGVGFLPSIGDGAVVK